MFGPLKFYYRVGLNTVASFIEVFTKILLFYANAWKQIGRHKSIFPLKNGRKTFLEYTLFYLELWIEIVVHSDYDRCCKQQ